MHTILAVDDELCMLESIEEILDDEIECNLLTALDADDAVTIANENSIDLVLLDLVLPRVGGAELLEKIARKCRKIVVMTAVSDTNLAAMLLQNGVMDFVTKPFDDPFDVLQRVNVALDQEPPEPYVNSAEIDTAIRQWRKGWA